MSALNDVLTLTTVDGQLRPTWQPPSGGSGITQLTGDVDAGPGSGSQVATIQPNVVDNTKLSDMATQTFKGRNTAGTGDPEDLSVATVQTMLGITTSAITSLTGDVTATGPGAAAATIANNAVTTAKINANAVTYAKIQTQADQTFLGNVSGSTAVPSALTIPQVQAALALAYTEAQIFGNGIDGDATVTTNNATLSANGSQWISSGKLQRDVYLNNLTINSSGSINCNGFCIMVNGTLDLSSAGALAIHVRGGDGVAASGTSGGAGGTAVYTVAGSLPGPAVLANAQSGGAGGTTTGNGPSGGTQGNASGTIQNGGNVVSSAIQTADGTGSSGNAGNQINPALATAKPLGILTKFMTIPGQGGIAWTILPGGGNGVGGAGGGGNGTLLGGGGGGGGSGGGVMYLAARTIATGSNTTAGLISIAGGNGGLGGTNPGSPGAATGVGGGQGGCGGGGGWAKIAYKFRTGSTVTNGIDHSGGSSGGGGAGKANGGTGNGGNGGASGGSGMLELYNIGTGSTTFKFPVNGTTPGNAHSGTTGGTALTNVQRTDL